MNTADIKKNAQDKMHKSIESLKNNFGKLRTGRAHTGVLEHIMVDYYGVSTQITQVANLNLIDARTIGVQVWEKNIQAGVEKAIRESGLGLNPSSQGNIIRIPMPALTEERRKELAKVVKGEGEDAKIAVRNARRDANDMLKKGVKDKALSEDDERRCQDEVQKFTDKFIVDIDKLVAEKEKDLMTV